MLYFGCTYTLCRVQKDQRPVQSHPPEAPMSLMGSVVSVGVVALLGRMSIEDRALKEKFGSEWAEWARRVPYLLIPGVY